MSNAKTRQIIGKLKNTPNVTHADTTPAGVPVPVDQAADASGIYVRLPAPPPHSERTAWSSQGFHMGSYHTTAGVSVGSTSLRVTVDEWDSPAALAELERQLLAALADVRAHAEYGTTTVNLARSIRSPGATRG